MHAVASCRPVPDDEGRGGAECDGGGLQPGIPGSGPCGGNIERPYVGSQLRFYSEKVIELCPRLTATSPAARVVSVPDQSTSRTSPAAPR